MIADVTAHLSALDPPALAAALEAQVSGEAGASAARGGAETPSLCARCPTPLPGLTCLSFHHADTSAPFDFWLLLVARQTARGTIVALTIPNEHGLLERVLSVPIFHEQTRETLTKVMRSSGSSFGPVSLTKMKVKILYRDTRELLSGVRLLRGVHDPGGRLVRPYADIDADALPPLPRWPLTTSARHGARSPGAVDREAALFDPSSARSRGGLYFRTLEGQGPDAEISDGELVEAPVHEAEHDTLERRHAPGFYVDVLERQTPPLALTIYSVVGDDGFKRPVFADYCREVHEYSFVERIIRRKHKSLFRSKTTIEIIREELSRTELVCGVEQGSSHA